MPTSYCNLIYHIVFSTKKRERWLAGDERSRVHAYMAGGVQGEGGIPILIGGTDDHVHLLVKLRQDKTVADVVRAIKANSSGWIHQNIEGFAGFAWQAGYGAFSVSQSQVERLKEYILKQEDHHKEVTFKDEFLAFLKANGIEYDERYIWD